MQSLIQFIHDLSWKDIPQNIQHMASRCVLDLSGTLIAGTYTELSQIVRNVVTVTYGGNDSTLPFDGRRVSAAGAALAMGMTIDAIDIHDGYRLAKGHAGCNIFPAALGIGEKCNWSGEEFMVALVMGYEIALRAAVALHQTACDYHTSGAWGALGTAAVTSRALNLDSEKTRHALGIAEYHGPRSQMMRVIDHPTMLKDGSGWGSMAGVIAAQLAQQGFTGAPALTVTADEVQSLWHDLGTNWRMADLYFKPYACCRWAQPAVEAAQTLVINQGIKSESIEEITVHTFDAATRLTVAHPQDTEQAQYSLPYPVAAMLVKGQLGAKQVTAPAIFDEEILQLADCIVMQVDEALEARFPAEALARVTLTLRDGRTLESDIHNTSGDPQNPLSDVSLNQKFDRLTSPYLEKNHKNQLREQCWHIPQLDHIQHFIDLLSITSQ